MSPGTERKVTPSSLESPSDHSLIKGSRSLKAALSTSCAALTRGCVVASKTSSTSTRLSLRCSKTSSRDTRSFSSGFFVLGSTSSSPFALTAGRVARSSRNSSKCVAEISSTFTPAPRRNDNTVSLNETAGVSTTRAGRAGLIRCFPVLASMTGLPFLSKMS